MKKQLLCTSAIALGVAAAPAMAQEWNLDWGGFYNADVLYNDVSGTGVPAAADMDGINLHTNAEIIFTPSVTLDNGMTFGVNVQLEAMTTGDQMDETFMYIESDTMGRIEMGNTNSAGYKLSTGAPSVGFGINSPSPSAFHPTAFIPGTPGAPFGAGVLAGAPTALGLNALGSSSTEVGGNNDIMRLSYYTPSFNGLTLGVSYASGQAQDTNGLVNRNGPSDVFDIGANYSQTFGNVDVELSARWGTGSAGTTFNFAASQPGPDGVFGTADDVLVPNTLQQSDAETWAVGASFGVAGFTFGGSYAESDAGNVANYVIGGNTVAVKDGAGDSEGWSLGVTYDLAGPWTVGFDTYQGEGTGGTNPTNGYRTKTEYEAYQIGAERELGAGVAWRIYAIQSETSLSTNNPAGFTPGAGLVSPTKYSLKSTTVGTGIRLNF